MGAKDYCVIDLEKELSKIADVSKDNEECMKKSIYRLPKHVTNLHEEAYKPWVVSLGPYHNGEEHLKPMETHKLRALHHFLHRTGKPLKSYVDALEEIVQDLREAYDDLDTNWQQDTKAFLRMMILDGCFIIEILHCNTNTIYDIYHEPNNKHRNDDDHYARYDPIFSKHGKINAAPFIKRDMLLIENQVPLMLLQKILAVDRNENSKQEDPLKLIFKFCSPDAPLTKDWKCLHILDVYRKSLISKIADITQISTQSSRPSDRTIEIITQNSRSFDQGSCTGTKVCKLLKTTDGYRKNLMKICFMSKKEEENDVKFSATEMKEAGIRFKCIKQGERPDGFSFMGRTLKLPKLSLDDTSESQFLNIIAFERFHVDAGNEVTSYIFFMNKLIRSVKDVNLLKEENIISNSMGSDEDVIQLFHTLSREITLDSNSTLDKLFVKVNEKLNNYYATTLNKWRYYIIHTYLKKPWAFISVLVAALILGLTATQTIYAILGHVNREGSTPTLSAPPHQ